MTQRKARFIITKSGKPTAILMGATDFDDILEELDPEFQKSLKVAAKEIRAGRYSLIFSRAFRRDLDMGTCGSSTRVARTRSHVA